MSRFLNALRQVEAKPSAAAATGDTTPSSAAESVDDAPPVIVAPAVLELPAALDVPPVVDRVARAAEAAAAAAVAAAQLPPPAGPAPAVQPPAVQPPVIETMAAPLSPPAIAEVAPPAAWNFSPALDGAGLLLDWSPSQFTIDGRALAVLPGGGQITVGEDVPLHLPAQALLEEPVLVEPPCATASPGAAEPDAAATSDLPSTVAIDDEIDRIHAALAELVDIDPEAWPWPAEEMPPQPGPTADDEPVVAQEIERGLDAVEVLAAEAARDESPWPAPEVVSANLAVEPPPVESPPVEPPLFEPPLPPPADSMPPPVSLPLNLSDREGAELPETAELELDQPPAQPLRDEPTATPVQAEPSLPPPAELNLAPPDDRATAIDPKYADLANQILVRLEQTTAAILLTGPDASASHAAILPGLAEALKQRSDGPLLLVDADFRRAALTRHLSVDSRPQRSDVSDGDEDWRERVEEFGLPGVRFLPGRTAPGQSLRGLAQRFEAMLEQMRAEYPLVLVSGPTGDDPLLPWLAGCCEHTYLVVRLGRSTHRATRQAVKILRRPGIRLQGWVMVRE